MKRTNRILPVYAADISGVCSALYELGGMTVMHDASGCNSTYTTHDEPRWYSMDSMVYISALSELEAVMGDDGKLVRDIMDAAANLHPRFICMGGTPIPMMMGTDFKGIARMIERQTGIPTFGIPTNGMHSYVQGAGEALRWIVRRFCPPGEELKRSGKRGDGALKVNILGATPLDFSLTGNIARMKHFLTSQGMEIVSCWAMESSLDQLMDAGQADVNLAVSGVGLPAARELRQMYGTPCVVGTPIGRGTALALAELVRKAAETGEDMSLLAPEVSGLPADLGISGLPPDLGISGLPADLGISGLPADLSGERVLIIGEQVIAGSLRCSLRRDLRADQVRVLCPMEEGRELAEDGDLLTWDEDEVTEQINRSTVVIGDPLYRQVYAGGRGTVFVDFPHEACSGRMYHGQMKPFIYD